MADRGRASVKRTSRPGVAEPYRVVAIPAAVALGAVGAIAAQQVHWPAIVGAIGGAMAAFLTVLALPSLSTRRVTIVLLGIGGLAALRHASIPGANSGWLLVLWAGGTLCTMLLVDRADAETSAPLPGGEPLPNRATETARRATVLGVVVALVAVALVPTLTDRLGRHMWPGVTPGFGDFINAPSSLKHSDTLDMTARPRLSNKVVFTVDASRPDYWRGEVFDTWDGHQWSHAGGDDSDSAVSRDGSMNYIDAAPEDVGATTGVDFRQTFHVEAGYSDVVFAAPSPRVVETDRLLHSRGDGTVVVAGGDGGGNGGFGKGAVYTVISRRALVTASQLRQSDTAPMPSDIARDDAQAPLATTQRVRDLAHEIAAGEPTSYDKILAFEKYLGTHTKYSLNAPLSPPGVDVVDDFVFRSKVGWCEQIASTLVMFARSVGIPARLATGFAPGTRDSLTGRFVVRENDAHAWAEIYFAGIGWQGFDPTVSVPLAGDAPAGGSWMQDARSHAPIFILFAVMIAALAIAGPGLVAAIRRRRSRQASWSARTLHRLERIGRKSGRPRNPDETPYEYAHALARHLGDDRVATIGETIDADAFSDRGAAEQARTDAEAVLTSL
jgi:transglutaminase-like putative cysteine protease